MINAVKPATPVRVTGELLELFDERRIFTATSHGPRIAVGETIELGEEVELEAYCNITAGMTLPRRMGAFSYNTSRLHRAMSIGRYCSIGPYVTIMGSRHPVDWVSTSPFSYHPQPIPSIKGYLVDVGTQRFDLKRFGQGTQTVTIGHDVWIGAEAILKPGITIGTGAVIAARSVVTRDVPPYAIVAGIPARIVRHRFEDALIEDLLGTEWWDFGPDTLQLIDVTVPMRFVATLLKMRGAGFRPPPFATTSRADILAAAGMDEEEAE